MANTLDDLHGRRHFDYIVIGCGGIGSGALYWLSKRGGHNVLGLEKFNLGHENGGSQDVSRAVRMGYPDDRYTKLARDMFKAWESLEKDSGMQLLYKPGGLVLAERGEATSILKKYESSMSKYGIPYELWDHVQLKKCYPQFTVGPRVDTLFMKDAGIVDAALGNSLHVQMAQRRGAKVLANCAVSRVGRAMSGLLEVQTPLATFTCKKVIVTAGAWINEVLESIGCHVPVYVTQENVTYFRSPHVKEFAKEKFPQFCYMTPTLDIYALPVHGISGTKIGIDAAGPVVTGDTRNFTPDPKRLRIIKDFLKRKLPKFLGPEMMTKTCLYTMTPDRHFLVDTCSHACFDDVIVCCGAGHAFKFASLLGKILSELAVDGNTQYDISGFAWNRPALTDPKFKPMFRQGDDLTPIAPHSKL